MQHSLNEWLSSSALGGANQSYIEDLYESYLEDPNSVDASWQEIFKTLPKSTALEFDKVLVSPYTRALETFDEINQVFEQQLSDKLEVWEGITPYGDSGLVSSYVALLEKEGHSNLLLISHLPLVGDIVKELCGRNPASFYPATIVDIHWDNDQPKVNDIKYVSKIA